MSKQPDYDCDLYIFCDADETSNERYCSAINALRKRVQENEPQPARSVAEVIDKLRLKVQKLESDNAKLWKTNDMLNGLNYKQYLVVEAAKEARKDPRLADSLTALRIMEPVIDSLIALEALEAKDD